MTIDDGFVKACVAARREIDYFRASEAKEGREPVMGSIDCPACKQPLHWMVMPNEHVHFECSKAGCIRWQE